MANQLMEIYWNVVFPLYPFFNREELSAEYRKLWNGEESLTCDEDTLMCTFNVIFALGCQLADFIKPEDRADMAGNFFARAQELLPGNMWHSGPSSVIQCLLLVSQYLQSTDSADQCWMVTGMAIRSAQGLGLHLPETSLHLENSHEQELVRKIWHGCVLMDRYVDTSSHSQLLLNLYSVVALTLGRPAMISKEAAKAVPLPVVVDEHRLQVPLEQTEESLFLKFYTKSLELYEILNDILLSLYKSPTPPSKPENSHNSYFNSFDDGQVAVFRLDHALSTWSLDLPPHLRTSSPLSSRDPISDRQSIVLRLRFLHVRMVLLRPILSKYCDLFTRERLIVSDDSLPQRFAVQCSILCVRSAQDLVDMVYNNFPPNGKIGKLPSWWYNILYVYTAATILIAGRLCPAILAEATEESVSLSWQRALNILRNYQSYSSSARRCVLALELLYEQINPSAAAVVSQRSPTFSHPVMNDVSLGEGVSAAVIDGFDLPDFVDMSWLNSVPSNLY
ncbi:hypothetical protein N7508_005319 [Penicillium antarcticum]|uniref:uncharacterized protein n=1 Tax=Penicillium antarcticum TaxID=416450 RepID=UPI00238E8A0B|nr:uncharacterized protein N7508_005319 [Penicillium antarcticum]KAJ5306304.1 hypothetical protein N7508_005319 [Penicillium antarcticum]